MHIDSYALWNLSFWVNSHLCQCEKDWSWKTNIGSDLLHGFSVFVWIRHILLYILSANKCTEIDYLLVLLCMLHWWYLIKTQFSELKHVFKVWPITMCFFCMFGVFYDLYMYCFIMSISRSIMTQFLGQLFITMVYDLCTCTVL